LIKNFEKFFLRLMMRRSKLTSKTRWIKRIVEVLDNHSREREK